MIQCKSKQHAASTSLPDGNIYLFYKLPSLDGGCRTGTDRQGEKAGKWEPSSRLPRLLQMHVPIELNRSHRWCSGDC